MSKQAYLDLESYSAKSCKDIAPRLPCDWSCVVPYVHVIMSLFVSGILSCVVVLVAISAGASHVVCYSQLTTTRVAPSLVRMVASASDSLQTTPAPVDKAQLENNVKQVCILHYHMFSYIHI